MCHWIAFLIQLVIVCYFFLSYSLFLLSFDCHTLSLYRHFCWFKHSCSTHRSNRTDFYYISAIQWLCDLLLSTFSILYSLYLWKSDHFKIIFRPKWFFLLRWIGGCMATATEIKKRWHFEWIWVIDFAWQGIKKRSTPLIRLLWVFTENFQTHSPLHIIRWSKWHSGMRL